MNFADRVKESTLSNSAAVIVLGGAVATFRSFASSLVVGDTNIPVSMDDGKGNWENGAYTLTSANTLTRTAIYASSNGGAPTVFPAGAKEVFCTLASEALNDLVDELRAEIGSGNSGVRDIPFATSVPLSVPGQAFMPQTPVGGALTFTPAAAAVRGALVYLRLVADGTNAPNFSAFKEWGGSLGYDNRAGIANQVQFFHDGVDSWVSISQAIGAAPGADATAPTMSGAISSSNITSSGFTTTWVAGSDNVGVASYEHSIDGGASYTNVGNVLTRTVSGLTASTNYPVRVRAVDAAGNRSGALALTVSTAATGTPGDTTAPTMNGSIAVSGITQTGYVPAWPAAADAVGVTGYEFSRNAGTSYVDLGNVLTTTVTNATAGSTEQLRVRAYDAAGNRAAPLSASVTMQSAPVDPGVEEAGRMVSLDRVAEEGTEAPYGYYPTATTSFGASQGAAGLFTKALQANKDGYLQVTFTGSSLTPFIGLKSTNTTGVIAGQTYGLFIKDSTSYEVYTNGSRTTGMPNLARQSGDIVRMRREGTSLHAEIQRTGTTEWILFYTWIGVPTGVLYFAALMAGSANPTGRLSNVRYLGLA